jgi:predicted membrane metal-binding protein
MALVAGVVFFVVRALLALSPALALRHAMKWSALAALIAALFYLLLSGAEVATQRCFTMTAIVLRNLAFAPLGVMLLAPEAVRPVTFAAVGFGHASNSDVGWRDMLPGCAQSGRPTC